MKQVFQNPKTGKTSVEEITPPRLRPGGVLVKNRFSVLSPGTERGIIELSKKGLLQKARERPDYVRKFFMLAKTKGVFAAWKVAQSKLATDIALGYSTSGEVIKVAKDVEGLQRGDRVACAGQDYASHAEVVFVPKNLCVRIPKKVSDRDATFATLGSIALHGIHQAKLLPGERVAVIGLGLLGQLAVRMLRAYGHPVVGFDVDGDKVQFAKKESGLDVGITVGKGSYEKGVDAAFIYASSSDASPLELAARICRDRGRVVQVGNVLSNIPWREFYKKELSFYSSRSYGPGRYDPTYEEEGIDYPIGHVRWTERRNMEEFLRLIEKGAVRVEDLVTDVFEIDEAEKAYEVVFTKRNVFGIFLGYPARKEKGKDTIVLEPRTKLEPGVKEIRIGFIGVGSFAQSTILPHLREMKDEGVKLAALCNATGKSVKDIAKKWGAEYVTNDYRKLLKDKSINLVICATRHSSHAKIAKAVLKSNKNLYMEKPLALNLTELKSVMREAQRSKGRLLVGFNRRFSKHFIKAREEFQGSLTPIMVLYRVSYPFEEKEHWSYDLREGGRIIGEDCHFIDAINFLTGSSPHRIYASVIPTGEGVEREENVVITTEYENGSVGNIFYSALGSFKVPKEYIEIYGDGKTMLIYNFKNGKVMRSRNVEKINLRHQDKGYGGELEALFEAVREGKPSPMSLKEIWDVHIAAFEAYESFKDGEVKKITLLAPHF